MTNEIKTQTHDLRQKDIVRDSNSPYNAPLWMVPKKPDADGNKKWRMVIDYRQLNEKTIGDAYPLPNIIDILDQLGDSCYFSVLDCASGFHQIPMHPNSRAKTAFSTPHGHLEFNRMPFGLKNAPATFQRLMDKILSGLQGTDVFVYIDDIIVHGKSLEDHNRKLRALLGRLKSAGLTLQPEKCSFLKKEIAYLGHVISDKGVQPDPKKIKAVIDFPIPKSQKNIKQFLGLVGYYRRFIPDFAKIAKPLNLLLKKGETFEWSHFQQNAFNILKNKICSEPILQYPKFDQPFIVTVDASNFAIGAVLSQGKIGQDLPISYASRSLNSAEINYSTTEKELLAIVWAVFYFRPYLFGRKFVLVTDHRPLTWLHKLKDPVSRLARWKIRLSEFDFTIVYKPGKNNVNADALSRNPSDSSCSQINSLSTLVDSKMESARHFSSNEMLREKTIPTDKQKTDSRCIEKIVERVFVSHGIPCYEPRNSCNPLKYRKSCDIRPDTESSAVLSLEGCIPDCADVHPVDRDVGPRCGDSGLHEGEVHSHGDALSRNALNDETLTNVTISNSCLTYSKDKVTMGKGHTLNLISSDRVLNTPANKELIDNKLLDRNVLQNQNLPLGHVTVLLSQNRYIFNLAVKDRSDGKVFLNIISSAISRLKVSMESLKVNIVKISKHGNDLNGISWSSFEQIIRQHFAGSGLRICICSGEIKFPSKGERENIIKEYHESTWGGHKGVSKTYWRIRENFYWGKLKTDVENFIRLCQKCQENKLVRMKNRQPMKITDTPTQPFEKIQIDIVGPLPKTSAGNEYILTIQDNFSKYSDAIPLPVINSVSVAYALAEEFISRHGGPRVIHTDQGRNFTSGMMKTFCKIFQIKQINSTSYHPQSLGSLERSHITLVEYLKNFASKQDWDEWLRYAIFSYNTSVHESTGFTPHALVYEREARLPTAISDETIPPTYVDYLKDLFRKISDIQATAADNLIAAKVRSKRYYDRKSNPSNFRENTLVYLLKEPKKSKLDANYVGPYMLEKLIGEHNAEIRINPNKTKLVHLDKLKLAAIPLNDKNDSKEKTVQNKE